MGTKEKCAAGLLLIGDLCPLPADAAGDVGDLHALGLQLIADTVGLGEVFGLLGVGPGPDQGLHLGILAAVLADHGEAAGGFTVVCEDGGQDPQVEALIRARADAKKAKNFAEADRIRDELKAQGVEITDVPGGVRWKRA